MHFGFLTIHPVTIPLGNELTLAITSAVHYSNLMYSGVFQPELNQLKEIISLL